MYSSKFITCPLRRLDNPSKPTKKVGKEKEQYLGASSIQQTI
jgi:hypothetical protein